MGWFIVLLFIVGPILICIWGEFREETKKPEWRPSTGSNEVVSVVHSVDAEETQRLLQSYYRFAGAVSAIRGQEFAKKNELQYAQVAVVKDKANEGFYTLRCNYDNDSNWGVEERLRMGGYLNYKGMKVIDEGFEYVLSRVNGDDFAYSPDAMIQIFLERNSDAFVDVERDAREVNAGFRVVFKFR